MYGRTNAGNLRLFSVISVVYPVGSICTCSNGQKTLTAKNATGQWVFNVPDTGTWTVTATKGDATASKTVDISSAGQGVSIILEYALYLLDSRVQLIGDVSGQWDMEYSAQQSFSQTADRQYFTLSQSGGGATRTLYYKAGVDVADYNTLEIYGYTKRSHANNRFGLLSKWDTNGGIWAANQTFNTELGLHVLDISNLSGLFYPALETDRNGGSGGDIHYISYMRLQV